MLVDNIAAVRDSVVLVIRTEIPSFEMTPLGTACHVGNGLFVTASHILHVRKPKGDSAYGIRFKRGTPAKWAFHAAVEVVHEIVEHDLAILYHRELESLPVVSVFGGDVPDGTSVFSYAFPGPLIRDTRMTAHARACPTIVAGRLADPRALVLGSSTYYGESGGPVFRQADNALFAVIHGSEYIEYPPDLVDGQNIEPRVGNTIAIAGPGIARHIASLVEELRKRGITVTE